MHIDKNADIASVILIAGDPRRTKWACENLLTDYKLVSDVRNAFVYTGYYKNHKVSFATSGMASLQLLFMFMSYLMIIMLILLLELELVEHIITILK